MLLSHTPSGAAAPDYIFCALLPQGQQHQPATRTGERRVCPNPCGSICPLQAGACVAPPALPERLAVVLRLSATLQQLLTAGLPQRGCLICRN